MIEQGELGTLLVIGLYAIAGVLAVIGGVVALRARKRGRGKH